MIGCQQNEHDGVRVNYMLEKLGLTPTPIENADLIVVVACSVRQTAVDRVFGLVKNNPDKKIILTGCVLDHDKKKFRLKKVVFWDIEKPEDLEKILDIKDSKKASRFLAEGQKISSSVPIMSGCNNFCTYCATAITRGRERSRKMEEIIRDVNNLIKQGQKEIILLGQNVNSYRISPSDVILHSMRDPKKRDSRFRGNDNTRKSDFTKLLEKLNELDGDFKISFMSNHPKDMTDDIIEAVASLPKIKKEIHLPLQSGSDKILREMNRPYTIQRYLDIVDNLKFKIQNLKLTTDVIVGFPGETEEDFQKTVDLFKKVNFDSAYINKYSPRKDTKAFKLGDPIPWSEKQRRWRLLNETVNKK